MTGVGKLRWNATRCRASTMGHCRGCSSGSSATMMDTIRSMSTLACRCRTSSKGRTTAPDLSPVQCIRGGTGMAGHRRGSRGDDTRGWIEDGKKNNSKVQRGYGFGCHETKDMQAHGVGLLLSEY